MLYQVCWNVSIIVASLCGHRCEHKHYSDNDEQLRDCLNLHSTVTLRTMLWVNFTTISNPPHAISFQSGITTNCTDLR